MQMTDRLFSVADFAKFSRTTKDTLYHYDKMGVLSPVSRGENNYRYYSMGQLALVNVIRTLQELGMTLTEIKEIKDDRTPELVNEVLLNQVDKIDQKIDCWINARKLLSTFQKCIFPVLNIDEDAIMVQSLPAEPIILGEFNDYSGGGDDYDALLAFYRTLSGRYPNLDLNYPVWAIYSKERVKKGEVRFPDRYYFYSPMGQHTRPAALYAIGYIRGGYGQGGALYERLIDYIGKNGYEICGDAYEEYPLNEVSISDDSNYLMRVMITVRKKRDN